MVWVIGLLTLILGRAGSGKTAAVMARIKQHVRAREGGSFLIVPEQYSHEAERELCAACGPSLSLFAEVLSFTGLARRVEAELGGFPGLLDRGGRLLCAARGLEEISGQLKVYGAARARPALMQSLLYTIDACKSAGLAPADLLAVSGADSLLEEKLRDIALFYGAYEAIAASGRFDPMDRLCRLAERISRSSAARGNFYIDGFTDFTRQEENVLRSLLDCGAELTVCLTTPALNEENEVFVHASAAARALLRMAADCGAQTSVISLSEETARVKTLRFLEKHLFAYGPETLEGEAGAAVALYQAGSVEDECRMAAAAALRLTRETHCRFRDIAVAARGFEDYRAALTRVFGQYGVPLYCARKTDLLAKPLPALLSAAFDSIAGGYAYADMFAYLKTGLAGLSSEECDLLENYVLLWGIRGSAWTKESAWTLSPLGYGAEETGESAALRDTLDALRRRAAEPLERLRKRGLAAQTAEGQAAALADFLEDIGLAARLESRASLLRENGQEELAAEYVQLWDIVIRALEQCAAVLGEMPMDQERFAALFALTLSQYDVGTIPISLDRVSAGDFSRMRRRHIKHLIVLGVSDERLPGLPESRGVLSPEELETLCEHGLPLGGWSEDSLNRELCLIYNCLSLPSESLTLCYCSRSAAGEEVRPSFLLLRIAKLLRLPVLPLLTAELLTWAKTPADILAALKKSDARPRGGLSPVFVRALYGELPRLSPTRAELLADCRFAYFLKYGLRAEPRKPAGFKAPEFGSFMHYVLEGVARSVMERGGFAAVSPAEIEALTGERVAQYTAEALGGFAEMSERFVYLFRRLEGAVRRAAADMAAELRESEFVPLGFELRFGENGQAAPIRIGDGKDAVLLEGIADRVDGWVHGGTLYLRVVDYKTGKRAFSLSDVLYGRGLQTLLYLFSLQKNGVALYHREVAPAGALVVPARDTLISAKRNLEDGEINRLRAAKLRRSGLVLDDPAVLAAMEAGDAKRYIPDTVSPERLELLRRHVERSLEALAGELHGGGIPAEPAYRGPGDNACLYCPFVSACQFDEARDRRRYQANLKASEVWERLEGQ